MTYQPRDLAAEAAEISRIHDEGRYDQYGEHPAESIGTLLDYIADLTRELEEATQAGIDTAREISDTLTGRIDELEAENERLEGANKALTEACERMRPLIRANCCAGENDERAIDSLIALAASQHTAGSGDGPQGLRLSGHQVNMIREFTDGDESFPVVIQRLPERTACNGDRMPEGLYVWSEDYPDEGVLLLDERPFGTGDGVAGD